MNELITIDEAGEVAYNEQALQTLAEYESAIKVLTEKEKELKQALLEEMEEKGVIRIDTPAITVTYIEPTERETLDSKALKAEYAGLYDHFVKMTKVKSSIRIKVK